MGRGRAGDATRCAGARRAYLLCLRRWRGGMRAMPISSLYGGVSFCRMAIWRRNMLRISAAILPPVNNVAVLPGVGGAGYAVDMSSSSLNGKTARHALLRAYRGIVRRAPLLTRDTSYYLRDCA